MCHVLVKTFEPTAGFGGLSKGSLAREHTFPARAHSSFCSPLCETWARGRAFVGWGWFLFLLGFRRGLMHLLDTPSSLTHRSPTQIQVGGDIGMLVQVASYLKALPAPVSPGSHHPSSLKRIVQPAAATGRSLK